MNRIKPCVLDSTVLCETNRSRNYDLVILINVNVSSAFAFRMGYFIGFNHPFNT